VLEAEAAVDPHDRLAVEHRARPRVKLGRRLQ
jgi:hypothetical protein